MGFVRRVISSALDLANLAKHNANFADIETDLTDHEARIGTAQGDITTHKASTSAHAAETITYSGEVSGAENLKEAVDSVKTELTQAIIAGDSGPEAAAARASVSGTVYPTLGDRLNAEYDGVTAQLADIAQLKLAADIDEVANTLNKRVDVEALRTMQIVRYGQFFQKLREGLTTRICCQGDSMTYGQDSTSSDKRPADPTLCPDGSTHTETRASTTFPEALQQFLQQINPNVTVINRGYSGDWCQRAYTRWNKKHNSDLTILMLGTNDATAAWVPEATRGNIAEYVKWYEQLIIRELLWDKAVIILTPPKARHSQLDYNEAIDMFRNSLQLLGAKYCIPVIDGEVFLRNYSGAVYSDSVHLNADGYKVFAAKVAAMLLGEGPENINRVQSGSKLAVRRTIDGFIPVGAVNIYEYSGGSTPPEQQYPLVCDIGLAGACYYTFWAETDDLIAIPNMVVAPSKSMSIQANFGTVVPENTLDMALDKVINPDNNLSNVDYIAGSSNLTVKRSMQFTFIKVNKGWNVVKISGEGTLNGMEFIDYWANKASEAVGIYLTTTHPEGYDGSLSVSSIAVKLDHIERANGVKFNQDEFYRNPTIKISVHSNQMAVVEYVYTIGAGSFGYYFALYKETELVSGQLAGARRISGIDFNDTTKVLTLNFSGSLTNNSAISISIM